MPSIGLGWSLFVPRMSHPPAPAAGPMRKSESLYDYIMLIQQRHATSRARTLAA
jgi:hypothetical protein